MQKVLAYLESQPRWVMATVSFALVCLIGAIDFMTGTELSLSVVYEVPIALGAWFVGGRFALIISCLSMVFWIVGDTIGGLQFSHGFLAYWNSAIRLLFYLVTVWMLTSLHRLQDQLEDRVRQRTGDLTEEIAERQRLEAELLGISEEEHRRIGHDLHDGLCQHLTGTALASQVLSEKLAQRKQPEATDAGKIVELIEQGIALSRGLAKGLHPIDMEADGLMQALQEFTETTSELFKVNCRFECDFPVLIHDSSAAAHLFRIAQEAVRNAVKHSQARRITIALESQEDGIYLRVEDNGVGLAETVSANGGMGLRIMAHRAKVIGASFRIKARPAGGTVVLCVLPHSRDNNKQAANEKGAKRSKDLAHA